MGNAQRGLIAHELLEQVRKNAQADWHNPAGDLSGPKPRVLCEIDNGPKCRLLSISRSSFYYELMAETAMNLDLIAVIDKPWAGNGLLCKP